MKSVPNKVFATEPKLVTTATLLKDALEAMPPNGFDLNTIRARLRLVEAIEKMEGETLKIEDADFSSAVQAVQQVKWVRLEKYLLQFAEQFGL